MKSILLITTGGTIGACPYENPQKPPIDSRMPDGERNFVLEEIKRRFPGCPIRSIAMEQRDSKHIDRAYRRNLIKHAEDAPEDIILVTHGTDTIVETGEEIRDAAGKSAKLAKKLFLLTGSMTPLSNGPESDGFKNLAFSFKSLIERTILPKVGIVLSDFNERHEWLPKLYDVVPGALKKTYAQDGRYHRLVDQRTIDAPQKSASSERVLSKL